MNASYIVVLLKEFNEIMEANKDLLIEMDSIVGDGDLGLTMADGFRAAYQKIVADDGADAGMLLYHAGKAMSLAVPSTMGTLMAQGLMSAGKALKGTSEIELNDIAVLFEAFEAGVSNLGKAKIGEKTFLDGIHPAVLELQNAVRDNLDLVAAAKNAVTAARKGYEDTAAMIAVHGRAATRGEASRTLKDPGAYIAVLLMEAFERTVV